MSPVKDNNFESVIRKRIDDSLAVKADLLDMAVPVITAAADAMINTYRKGGAVYWFGNGGSAADAQHLACELVNRFYLERPGIRSQAFTTNTSILTAVSNDYSYEQVFEKQVEAFAEPGDILVGISTSGTSQSVINALKRGRKIGTINIGFTGAGGGVMKEHVDHLIAAPSNDTPIVQECHIMVGHILCFIVEHELFGRRE
jgi:D-sedoheptulose 7-phosphate isomerase